MVLIYRIGPHKVRQGHSGTVGCCIANVADVKIPLVMFSSRSGSWFDTLILLELSNTRPGLLVMDTNH